MRYAKWEFRIGGTEASEFVSIKFRSQSAGLLLTRALGLRTRRSGVPHLRRPLDRVLRIQDGHLPRPRDHSKVSRRCSAPLLFPHPAHLSTMHPPLPRTSRHLTTDRIHYRYRVIRHNA
jgi:hypothetical protein